MYAGHKAVIPKRDVIETRKTNEWSVGSHASVILSFTHKIVRETYKYV